MPSGFSHIILARTLDENNEDVLNSDLVMYLSAGLNYFQVGALGPDLPYSQQPNLLNSEQKIADKYHLHDSTQIVSKAMDEIKNEKNEEVQDKLFCFFLGFMSHIVADGIIHPFVRDKVGNYKGNEKEHRILEMKLDSLLFHEVTRDDLNCSEAEDGISNILEEGIDEVSSMLSRLTNEAYNTSITSADIRQWIQWMEGIFSVAAKNGDNFYANFPGLKNYLFPPFKKLLPEREELALLSNNKVNGRSESFLARDVHFFNDCLPKYFEVFGKISLRLFNYVYNNGPRPDLIPINLDTGRCLTNGSDGNDLNMPAAYWEYV
jgi:hypothetical protein